MNTSRRGAVIATAILAGTLSSLLVVIGYLAATTPGRNDRPAAVASTQIMGSLPRPSQVRPGAVAVKSTPTPSPSAAPTARPSTAATLRPTTVAAEPPSRPAPAPTPWPTPRPVATPPPPTLTTALSIQVYEAPLNASIVTIGQAGPVYGTVTTASQVAPSYAVNIQGTPGSATNPIGSGGVEVWYLNIEATWEYVSGSPPATMTLNGAITGSYGCPGSMQSMTTALTPTTSASGSVSEQLSTITGGGAAACPGGSAPTATFTASAALSPG